MERPLPPVSAYDLFVDDHIEEVRSNYPRLAHEEIDLELNEIWNDLPEEGRDFYNRLAIREQQRYQEEMQAWRQFQRERRARRYQMQPNPWAIPH